MPTLPYSFGAGSLFGVRTDSSNQTPVQFGVLQEVTLEFNATNKELIGQLQYPVAVARGGIKITGKAKSAKISALAYNNLFFGATLSQNAGILTSVAETGTVPGTPYQITVTNSATFATDLGVVNSTTGVPYVKVASSPSTGEYSVSSGGVYTFAAVNTTNTVLINYTYTTTSGAQKIAISNQLMGSGPVFQMNLAETYQSNVLNIQLNQCMATKLSIPLKNEDFTIPDFEFSAFADSSGNIGNFTTSNL